VPYVLLLLTDLVAVLSCIVSNGLPGHILHHASEHQRWQWAAAATPGHEAELPGHCCWRLLLLLLLLVLLLL
jgi:hypothetical protein